MPATLTTSTASDLTAALVTAFAGGAVSVYPAPPSQVKPPAVVIRADAPWRQPGGLCPVVSRWLCVAVVAPTVGAELWDTLEAIAGVVETTAGETGWRWTGTDPPYLDESTGTPLLAVSVHVEIEA